MQRGYAKSAGAHLAYSIVGTADLDLLYVTHYTLSFDSLDDEPHVAHYFRRLAAFGRLIRFDVRGVGLSDPIDTAHPPSVESAANDIEAVLDACDVERAAIIADGGGEVAAIEFVATRPERATALVVINGSARTIADETYPEGVPREFILRFLEQNLDPDQSWSQNGVDDVDLIAPTMRDDAQFRAWWSRASARSASPLTARAIVGLSALTDVRHRLPDIAAPTLVVHRRNNVFSPIQRGRYIAHHTPNARLVELSGADHAPWTIGADEIVDEIEEFLTGQRSGRVERILATVLFTDIVDSTGRAVAMGDAAWRAYLDVHDAIVRRELARYGGREVNTTGDGFVAAFESPTQAVQCAHAIVKSAAAQGIAIRAGLHTGESERRGNDLAGLAVHIAARVAGLAASGEVLVSRTVRDLVSGSELRFVDCGDHELKGVPETWQLFALVDT